MRRTSSAAVAAIAAMMMCLASAGLRGIEQRVPVEAVRERPESYEQPAHTTADVRRAVLRALPLIEASGAEYRSQRQCFSCHHQALPILTDIEARLRGFAIDEINFQAQLEHTAAHLRRGRGAYAEGRGQGGQVDTAGWALWCLSRGDYPADETTEAVVDCLIKMQRDVGHWQPTGRDRRPTQGSDFTSTFLALYGVSAFATADQAVEVDERVERVKAWLIEAQTTDIEDHVFRLRALDEVGADREVLQSAAAELLRLQGADGGWAQTHGLDGDAYATGTVLAALYDTQSLDAEHAAYQRGVNYLLRTQLSDGSWKVETRATPIQTYFESGFPHETDQFISMAATCWATLALLKACPEPAATNISAAPNDARQEDSRSLKVAAGNRFQVGVGVSHFAVRDADNAALIRQHFQILTPENCMKPQSIHPDEHEWDFEASDQFVDFARANQFNVFGHCLVWAKDDRTDPWMMQEDGKPVSRETLLRRIETHAETVVRQYAPAVTSWDVVNEALADGGEVLLRDSVYSRTTGIEFIVTAFEAARANDPNALLIYNDYNCHKPEKRAKLIELLTQLKNRGVPVDAYGMQGHFELGDDSIPQLRDTFAALRQLGIKVVVSELDIDVVTRSRWWADDGKHREELATYDPYKNGLPAEVEQKQARQYAELFQLFVESSDIIERVSFWNLHDGESWLNAFPWRRVNHPLLFDRHRAPKAAFSAVYEVLQDESTRLNGK